MSVFRTKAESMNPAAATTMAISWNRTKSLSNMEQLCKSSLQCLISTNWIELDKPYIYTGTHITIIRVTGELLPT